ncbi:hypothetical protein BJ508DRAFT_64760 [Ascobolus immersus RN42]|uniref:Uncharacterized protein n=1 Tax=Ascobolus immersus RN42 TaxID=1160509 RepID=A0A3N4J1N1_ASCIM|nr:hypothetical protein BJ508DRAFT_64760 [Ascobolus immersus RN42]
MNSTSKDGTTVDITSRLGSDTVSTSGEVPASLLLKLLIPLVVMRIVVEVLKGWKRWRGRVREDVRSRGLLPRWLARETTVVSWCGRRTG